MPDLNQDQQALQWLVQNPNDRLAPQVMQKLGVDAVDVQAWDFAEKNQTHELAAKVRNKVYDKVAAANPAIQEQGVGVLDRFAIKNLINENTDLQQAYLQKKGFETRIVGDNVEVRKPGDTRFSVIDPEGLDVWDVTDLVGDVAEGIAGAFATGTKALGALGAPVTLGGSLVAGSALGGAATGGLETVRQGIGIATGLRNELDVGEIAKSTAAGAIIPGAGKLIGKAFTGAGKGAKSLISASLKTPDEVAAIKEAAKVIGAKATPAQLSATPLLQKHEAALSQISGKLGGTFLRRDIQRNIKAVEKTAKEIVKDASELSPYEIGDKAGKKMIETLAEKLKPAEEIYQKYEAQFARKAYKPNLTSVENSLNELKKDFRLNDDALKLISKFEEKLPQLKNLDDVKQFRTLVRDSFNPADSASKRITSKLGNDLTQVRSDTLKNLAESSDNPEFFQLAKKEIEQADAIYKQSINDVESTVLNMGDTAKLSPKAQLKKSLGKMEQTKRIETILKTSDPDKILAVKRAFPEAFETLRQRKIQNLTERVKEKGKVNASRLANAIKDMGPETAHLIFGPDAVLKAKALKTFMDSNPNLFNPSRSGELVEFVKSLNILSQLGSLYRSSVSSVVRQLENNTDILSKTGRVLTKEVGGLNIPTALGISATKGLRPPQRDNRGLQLPKNKE